MPEIKITKSDITDKVKQEIKVDVKKKEYGVKNISKAGIKTGVKAKVKTGAKIGVKAGGIATKAGSGIIRSTETDDKTMSTGLDVAGTSVRTAHKGVKTAKNTVVTLAKKKATNNTDKVLNYNRVKAGVKTGAKIGVKTGVKAGGIAAKAGSGIIRSAETDDKTISTTIGIAGKSATVVKTVVTKKAIIKLTAKLAIKAVILATKAIVAIAFKAPVIVPILLIVIVIIGIISSVASVGAISEIIIPIEVEEQITNIHTSITSLDLEFSREHELGFNVSTYTKDFIAWHFISDDFRAAVWDNNHAFYMGEIQANHYAFHTSSAGNLSEWLRLYHNKNDEEMTEIAEFKEIAWLEFYDQLGDPYEIEWRHAVTSPFGWRASPFPVEGYEDEEEPPPPEFHSGVDIGKPQGTPVLATISGTVVITNYDADGYGNWIMILNRTDPTNRLETRYAHLYSILVVAGDVVERGQVIGLTGSTGRSSGPHLHHEFRRNNLLLNPYFYFPPPGAEMRDLFR